MTTHEPIPFLDLITPHREMEDRLLEVVRQAFRTAGFVGGPIVAEFEESFARFCGTDYCVGVGSGTDALRFALIAAGVSDGDVVVTVPNTFIATTEAISQAGGIPEFVDVDEHTYNMASESLRDYLENLCTLDTDSGRLVSRRSGRRVMAVVPVHLYGQMADMDPILALADQYGLTVIEDACQAHGAEYFSRKHNRWFKAGSMGQAGAFSFYPGKNLGACGEAGAITTNDEHLARTMRMVRDHGQAKKYYHDREGYNGRLDAIQAGILKVKLEHLAIWNSMRRDAAARYRDLLADHMEITLPEEPNGFRAIYHLFVVRVAERDNLMKHLAAVGIGTGIHYPIPLHLQKAYAYLQYVPGDFPKAEAAAREIVSLPMFPTLTAEQQAHVVDSLLTFVNNRTAAEPALSVSVKES